MDLSRLLLDSHVLIWWINGEKALGSDTRQKIDQAEAVYVSAGTIWELNIKTALGQMQLPNNFEALIAHTGFVELPVTFAHAKLIRTIQTSHADPFDKILLAQGLAEGIPLVTADKVLLSSKYQTIDARK